MGLIYTVGQVGHPGKGIDVRVGMTSVLGLPDPKDTLKALRETLCLAQAALGVDFTDATHGGDLSDAADFIATHSASADPGKRRILELCQDYLTAAERIGRLIAEIDRQRPLGPDGKHGGRHTLTCGCED